jgi:hypothetical protein
MKGYRIHSNLTRYATKSEAKEAGITKWNAHPMKNDLRMRVLSNTFGLRRNAYYTYELIRNPD